VIVAGTGAGEPGVVHALAEALGWPVLADPRSGCRVPARTTVAAADAILRARPFEPQVVLRLGAPWASRVVNEWLGSCGAEQWLVDPHAAWRDPERTATRVVVADPTATCVALAAVGTAPAPPDWLGGWLAAEAAAQSAIANVLAEHPSSEPAVARRVLAAVPDGGAMVVSSSMPVRDVEWYGLPRTGARVLANRGANGIDGVVSSALGVAASGVPTLALVGDLALVHDVGALALAARRPDLPYTVVVVDNDGGGIFSFLPQASSLPAERFEELFGTPHGLDLAAVAAGFGLPVVDLEAALSAPPAGVSLAVVRTDRAENVAVHAALHHAVAQSIM
jgi:2-succinyl-5-enolpyruvyl-6-hydroxy-3-cyclohexene-1-carboxylate synthase